MLINIILKGGQISVQTVSPKLNTKKKTFYISFLALICSMSVVFGHANSFFWSRPTGFRWVSAVFTEATLHWAVGIFFMISGATLIDYRKRYTLLEYMKKRFLKTAIPFVFWYVFALILPYLHISFTGIVPHITLDFPCTPIQALYGVTDTKYAEIYWFFIPLFFCYLLIPVFAAFRHRNAVFNTVIALMFVVYTLIPFCCKLTGTVNRITPYFSFQPEYFIFVLLGYQLSTKPLGKKLRCVIYTAGIIGWAMCFFGMLLTSKPGEISEIFKGDLNLPAFMEQIAVFVFFRYFDFSKIMKAVPKFEPLVYTAASCSFGVYLTHYYFIVGFPKWFNIDTGSLMWRFFGALFIFVLCTLISALCKKVPVLKRLIP